MSHAIVAFAPNIEKDLEEAFAELDGISGILAVTYDDERRQFWYERLTFWQNEIRLLVDVPKRPMPTKFVP